MKKKLGITIIVIAIIAVLVGIMVYCLNQNNTKELSLCQIKTYDGEVITDYTSNYRAFMISDFAEETTITVNGEAYEANRGFYQPGTYEIEAKNGSVKEKQKVTIKGIDSNQQNEYNIFITAETLPTFFASFDMIKQKETPAYVWFQRADTLNTEALQEMFTDVTISQYVGEESSQNFLENVRKEIQEYVIQVLKNDENAHFNVYVTAEYYWLEIATLEELGLTDERVHTTMYSCGTVDYVVDYSFTEENTYQNFLEEKQNFEEALDKARSNLCADDTNLNFLKKPGEIRANFNYVLISALRDNVTYCLQFPEMITFKDSQVEEAMKDVHMEKVVARDKFNELTDEQKEQFFKCINLDKEQFDTEYFNSESGKYLIITGTRPYYGNYTQSEFENMIDQVVQKYGEIYTILFKPHPSAIPDGNKVEYLNQKNIKILPGKMPMEAISFIYEDLKLGGFASSLYMSVDEGNTLFFFSDSKDSLVEPLNVLYDDLFTEAEFIQPK